MEVVSLRERMKREPNRAIARAAQDLVHERALNEVTVDDIARTAGVSVRTFFNYFSCKEEAVVGIPEELLIEFTEALRARPEKVPPLEALRTVLGAQLDQDTILPRWQIRNELVNRYPALLPHYLAALVQLESALARSLAVRMGVDHETDPSPRMLVAAVLAALRAGTAWWHCAPARRGGRHRDKSGPRTGFSSGHSSRWRPTPRRAGEPQRRFDAPAHLPLTLAADVAPGATSAACVRARAPGPASRSGSSSPSNVVL